MGLEARLRARRVARLRAARRQARLDAIRLRRARRELRAWLASRKGKPFRFCQGALHVKGTLRAARVDWYDDPDGEIPHRLRYRLLLRTKLGNRVVCPTWDIHAPQQKEPYYD